MESIVLRTLCGLRVILVLELFDLKSGVLFLILKNMFYVDSGTESRLVGFLVFSNPFV